MVLIFFFLFSILNTITGKAFKFYPKNSVVPLNHINKNSKLSPFVFYFTHFVFQILKLGMRVYSKKDLQMMSPKMRKEVDDEVNKLLQVF